MSSEEVAAAPVEEVVEASVPEDAPVEEVPPAAEEAAVVEETPAVEEPAVAVETEQPAAEEPAAETPAAEEPAAEITEKAAELTLEEPAPAPEE